MVTQEKVSVALSVWPITTIDMIELSMDKTKDLAITLGVSGREPLRWKVPGRTKSAELHNLAQAIIAKM